MPQTPTCRGSSENKLICLKEERWCPVKNDDECVAGVASLQDSRESVRPPPFHPLLAPPIHFFHLFNHSHPLFTSFDTATPFIAHGNGSTARSASAIAVLRIKSNRIRAIVTPRGVQADINRLAFETTTGCPVERRCHGRSRLSMTFCRGIFGAWIGRRTVTRFVRPV